MRMIKVLGLFAALAALTVAAPAVGAPPEGKAEKGKQKSAAAKAKNATKRVCQAERRELGRDAFREQYGDELKNGKFAHAMRNCKRANRSEVRAATREAAQDCRAERDELGAEAFRDTYGTGPQGRNAFGKCVSTALKNAAKECKAEREADPETFATTYGEGRNAFGKCVSSKVSDDTEETPEEPPVS